MGLGWRRRSADRERWGVTVVVAPVVQLVAGRREGEGGARACLRRRQVKREKGKKGGRLIGREKKNVDLLGLRERRNHGYLKSLKFFPPCRLFQKIK